MYGSVHASNTAQVEADTERMRQLERGLNTRLEPHLLQLQSQTARLAALRQEQAQAQQDCSSLTRCNAALAQVGHRACLVSTNLA